MAEEKAIWWAKKNCYGYEVLPNWLREAYIKGSNFKCQEIDCQEKDLEIHRIIRGNQGGLYTVAPLSSKKNNVQVLCKKHHKIRHTKEEGCRKR